MRLFILFLSILIQQLVYSQFVVNEPIVNTGVYAITDSIFMDPNGDDANPGTFALPVKSFSVAMQKLPYGSNGVNGGNAYGVIKLKAGYYITNTGFHQSTSNWKNGNVYKNISLEGIGDVTIGGLPGAFATGHLLSLSGNHIYIKNIKLKYSSGIGLLLSRNDTALPRQSNVVIDHVIVDSVGSFSMLLTSIDSILVKNSASLHSSRPGNSGLSTPCQWPSGIKFLNSHDCTIHHSEVAYSRGEGLNFQNSLECAAYQNKLHDNGLNLYNDNSAKLYIHRNHIYNTPNIGTQYWRNCPADTNKIWATSGMLIANEGSCVMGNLPGFNGCQTKCVLPNETFSNVDSMFIYNNVIQNVGEAIGFWEGNTNITGINCIRNVFFFNNTVIGVMGMQGANQASLIKAYFPDYNILFNSYYGYLQNVKITNNIFTFDTITYPNMRPVNLVFHPQHPGPKDITFNNNLWIKAHANMGVSDLVRSTMPGSTYLLSDTLNSIQPCTQQPYWVYSNIPTFSFLDKDYLGRSRNGNSNVGALEYATNCTAITGLETKASKLPEVFPNPCLNCTEIFIRNLDETMDHFFILRGIDGKELSSGLLKDGSISTNGNLHGLFFLFISGEKRQYVFKLLLP